MKKRITAAAIAAMLICAMLLTGCMNDSNSTPTPTPQNSAAPITSPDSSANGDVSGNNGADDNGIISDNNTGNGSNGSGSNGSGTNGSGTNGSGTNGSGSNNGTVGQAIENFVEGMTVELATLPENIRNAIKKEYPEATIKTVTYTTYENKQMYKVTAESGEDKHTEEFYVTADGEIVPVKNNTASPSPDSSPKQ